MTKLKILILVILVVTTGACIAALGYLMWKNHARTQEWERIQHACDSGNWEEADKLLVALTHRDPGNENAYRLLAQTAEKRLDYWNAIWYWGRVAALNPLDRDAVLNQASAMLAAGQYPMAVQLLEPLERNKRLTPQDQISLCEALTYAKDQEKAQELYDRLIAGQEDSPRLQLCHAELLRQKHQLPEAEAIFLRYLDGKEPPPIRWAAALGLGDIAVERHDNRTAEKYYRIACELLPERSNWLLGQFYFATGQWEQAQHYLEQELALHPYQYVAAAELGEIYAARNLSERLIELRKSLTMNQKIAIETGYYLDAMEAYMRQDYPGVNQKLTWAESYRIRSFYQLMKFTADIAEKNIMNLPHDVKTLLADEDTPERRAKIVAMLLPLLAEVNTGDRADDARILIGILEPLVIPDSPEANLVQETRMVTAFTAHDYQQAAMAAQQVLLRSPDSAPAREILALSLYESQQYARCLPLLETLPPTRENMMRRATALRLTGAMTAARDLLQTQWQAHPDDREFFDAYIEVLIALKEYDKAAATAERLPDTPADRYARHLALAHIAAAQDKIDAAKEHYLACIEALAALPATPETEYQTAYLYALTDQNGKAAELYEKLLASDPKWPLVLVNLSEVKAALGDRNAAFRYAAEAQRLYPTWEAAQECLMRRQKESAEAWEKEVSQ